MTDVPLPDRVAERPKPSLWAPDELLTPSEAAALFWPGGPLRERSLRVAIRAGQLPYVRVARRIFVTRDAIAVMSRCGIDGRGASSRGVREEEGEDG